MNHSNSRDRNPHFSWLGALITLLAIVGGFFLLTYRDQRGRSVTERVFGRKIFML